jgi:hypothetical protein
MKETVMRPTHRQHSVVRQTLDRRTLLRGVIAGFGVSIGLPALEIMLDANGTALAAGTPLPKRFGVFYWGGGIVHSTWTPSSTGTSWSLPGSFGDFSDLQKYLTLATGINHPESSPGHIPARGDALSASHDLTINTTKDPGTYRGQNMPEPSIDNIVSDAWKGQTPFDAIQIGICRAGPYASNTSWMRGGTTYNRHEPSPQALFDRLFKTGVATTDTSMLSATTALDKSMLDALKSDSDALLQRKLGATDRQRVEQHLEGFRSLEMTLQDRQKLGTTTCKSPDRPTRTDFGDGGTHEEKEAKSQIMSDLLAVALACDMTRVFSYEFSAGQSGTFYWEVGVNREEHQLTHDDPQGMPMQVITRFKMKNLAYLARALAGKTEGAGNVLDNTLIFGTSEHAVAGFHDNKDHPFVFVGKAGGAFKAGLHYRNTNTNNLDGPKVLLTAVRAVGVSIDQLGQGGGESGRQTTDSIADLLA